MARVTLLVTIGIGLVFGVFSTLFFLWRWIAGPPPALVVWLQIVASIAFVILLLKGALPVRNHSSRGPLVPVLIAAGLILSALVLLLIYCVNQPHGEWDAWAIWNLHARFLFRAGANWTDMFAPELFWTHNDYPFLMPALIAAGWTMAGVETTTLPTFLGFIFGAGTVALLIAATCYLQRGWRGLAAGVVLVAMPDFVLHGAYQAADVPLAFYFLLTLVLVQLSDVGYRSRLLFMAGMAAAFSAWTKNEGLLFLVVLGIAWLLSAFITRTRQHFGKDTLRLAAGAAPLILLILALKLWVVPRNDLFMQPDSFSARLLDLSRYRTIVDYLHRELWQLGGGPLNAAFGLAALIAFTGVSGRRVRPGTAEVCTLLAVVLMTAGYFMVYVITPLDLEWHLSSSLERLVLQLWPIAVLAAACFAVPPSQIAQVDSKVTQPSTLALKAAGIALASLGVLLPIALSLSPQPDDAHTQSAPASATTVELVDEGPVVNGFAELKNSTAAGILDFRTAAGARNEVVLLPSVPSSSVVVPFRNSAGFRTSIAITNTGEAPTEVAVSTDGRPPSMITVPGKTQIAGFIDQEPFGIRAEEGSMEVRSSAEQLLVSAFLTAEVPLRGFYMASLPIASTESPGGGRFRIPHVFNHATSVADLFLANAAPAPVSGTYRLIDGAGSIIDEQPYRIQPRNSARFELAHAGEASLEVIPASGTPAPVAGIVKTDREAGMVTHLAQIGAASEGLAHSLLVESSRQSKTDTEIEIANNGRESAEVEIDLAGLVTRFTVLPETSMNVPVKNLKGFPWLPDPLYDIVQVKSNQPVGITVLRWSGFGGDRRLMAAYGRIGHGAFFPYFASGSGFAARFVLSGAGTLNIMDSSGKPLEAPFRERTSQ